MQEAEYAERRRRHAAEYAAKKAAENAASRRWVVGFSAIILWSLTACLGVFLLSPPV